MSAEQTGHGYVYRIAKADTHQLQTIVATHVGAGWSFGGAAQWDFVAERGRENLRQLAEFAAGAAIELRGDFGHAFSDQAEVRWKRRDDGAYDVLILREDGPPGDGAEPLRWWNSAQERWEDYDWRTRRYEQAAIVWHDGKQISYIDYLAPNGAVQFQRLVRVVP
jgi:hypothetical protein